MSIHSSTIVHTMSIRRYQIGVVFSLWIVCSVSAISQTHKGHSGAMSHAQTSTELPRETGQSAFAAIAEIVAMLENDPDTDWSTVNIDTLRNHLVDMNQLVLSSSVTTKELEGQAIRYQVTGQGRTLQAIQSMIPAHAKMLSSMHDWNIVLNRESDGVTVEITPSSPEEYIKLKALGFFGFMTIGAHHHLHHLQMAKGMVH